MIESQFTVNAALTAARADLQRLLAPAASTLDRVFLFSDTAMSGADAIFDVNINGVSIWDADQTQRPKITSGNSTVDKTSIAATVAEFDVITVDFDGFSSGSHSVGGKLIVVIQFTDSGGGGSNAGMVVHATPTSISLSNNTRTPIPINNVINDDGSFFDSTNKAATLTVPGYYLVVGQITFAANATGKRHVYISQEDIGSPGTLTPIQEHFEPANASGTTSVQISMVVPPTWIGGSGSRIYLEGMQDSGGSLSAGVSTGNANTFLAVVPIKQP